MAFAAIAVVEAECEKSSATTYFWYREALDISNSISESGGLNWKMTLCLLVAWTIVGLAVVKGIQSSGKVSQAGTLRATWSENRMEGRGLRTLGCPIQGPEGERALWVAQGDNTGPPEKALGMSLLQYFSWWTALRSGLVENHGFDPPARSVLR